MFLIERFNAFMIQYCSLHPFQSPEGYGIVVLNTTGVAESSKDRLCPLPDTVGGASLFVEKIVQITHAILPLLDAGATRAGHVS